MHAHQVLVFILFLLVFALAAAAHVLHHGLQARPPIATLVSTPSLHRGLQARPPIATLVSTPSLHRGLQARTQRGLPSPPPLL